MGSFITNIAVSVLILAIIFPIALTQFFGVDTGSWDADTILLWGIIPLAAILAVVLVLIRKAQDQTAFLPIGAFAFAAPTINVPIWYGAVVAFAMVAAFVAARHLAVTYRTRRARESLPTA